MYSKQKSLNFGQYVPNDKVLNKKIPENPKYKHVKPAVDSGKNVRRHIDELKEKQKNCSQKKDEVFKRIKFSTFVKLAIAVASDLLNTENSKDATETKQENSNAGAGEPQGRKLIANVLMGIGELDVINEKRKPYVAPRKQEKKLPYLLLDVRDRDAYSQCHIITAKHYPAAMLSRSIGYETEELKLYKNRLYELIILYDDDEVIAARVATTLMERGYENIYIISGGLKFALEIVPHGLTTSAPVPTPVHMPYIRKSTNTQTEKSASKEYFSQEDIDTIQQYIEAYPRKGDNSLHSSRTKSSLSYSKKVKSAPDYLKTTTSNAEFTSRHGSVTSRRDSASSSRSIEPTQIRSNAIKSATDGRSKVCKKAPWK